MNHELLEQRIDELVRGVLANARELALAAVSEAFSKNEVSYVGHPIRTDRVAKKAKPRQKARRPAQKRSPEELSTLGEKLCAAISKKPGQGMTYYAKQLSSIPTKLNVPMRRLVEERRVHAIGERNQRKYYPGALE